MLWWLISLGIAAAIIYYVFSARGEIRDVEPGSPVRAGMDEELGTELEPELGLGEIDEGMAGRAVPTLDDDDTAVTTLTNLDEAGAIARGIRGEGGHDEEYGNDLPVHVRDGRNGREVYDVPEDEDDYEDYEDDDLLGDHGDPSLVEAQTYMKAGKVEHETRSDKKRRKRRRKH